MKFAQKDKIFHVWSIYTRDYLMFEHNVLAGAKFPYTFKGVTSLWF